MTTEIKDTAWLLGFLGRHVSRYIRGRDWEKELAAYRLLVTVLVGHTIELHDRGGSVFRLVHTKQTGARVAWVNANFYRLRSANEKRMTSDVRRMLRRHGLMPARNRRTA